MGITSSTFLDACYSQNKGRLPVWIMRQAGRYLPEYREVRSRVSFQELCHSPEIIAEVVRQPVEKFGLDAAILFSDILTMLEPMGAEVSFPDGGPKISNPIKNLDDVKSLREIDPEKELDFVLDGIRAIKNKLPNTPLIGFCGAPFTLACYLIEGGGSKDFAKPRRFLHEQSEAATALIDLLTKCLSRYLRAQINAGAEAVQVFGSWSGVLSPDMFARFVAEPVTRIFENIKDTNVPRILFVNNIAPYLDQVCDIPCEVIGVDYRLPLRKAMDSLPNHAIQGNLDPAMLFARPEKVREATIKMLDSVKDHNRLIVNLGHGIQPETPIESVEAFVETIHNYRS
ncbi:MAG: uroporphyrinogen decarboxylase [bacterium]